MILSEISAKKVKDSRGKYTIEVSVNKQKASSPSGKSTGKFESKEYYKNIDFCIKFLNNWDEKIEINKFDDLKKVEKVIKKKLKLKHAREFGGNSLFAFESAILKALAKENKKDLWEVINPNAKRFPMPVGNSVGGGLHSSQFKNHPDFQEFLVIPRARKFSDAVKILNSFYKNLRKELKAKYKNDEGAWQTEKSNEEVLDIFNKIRKDLERKFRFKIGIGLDVAANSLFKNKKYVYRETKYSEKEQAKYIVSLIYNYDLFYMEDPVDEDDFSNFSFITKKSRECMIVGDDLTVTHPSRVRKAIKRKSMSAMIIKPNQNGSLIDVKEVVDLCKNHNIKMIFSHRSGETIDDALADLAFGFGANFMKCGVSTKWREAKLKRMLAIEKSLR